MKIKTIMMLLMAALAVLLISSCKDNQSEEVSLKRDAKALKIFGPKVKQYDESLSFVNIYPNNGNDQKLSAIAADYLGRSLDILHVRQVSKEFKPDYIQYKFEVDDLPLDLKGFNTLFSKEDKIDSKGKRENVLMEFTKSDNVEVKTEHTMVVDFSSMANSVDPIMKYGFDNKTAGVKKQLHIKKLKSSDFRFEGSEKTYLLGASEVFSSELLVINYDKASKKYHFKSDSAKGELDIDRAADLYKGSKDLLFDDMKYCAIVNNIKLAQNKYIKSGGYYNLDGVLRFLSNSELNASYPLRDMYKGEALMRHIGTSISDGQSYVKLIMDDTQIALLIDVNGYISQYQQVIVDKEKGIVEKTVLVRK